jgi:hypothetical protein
MIGDCSTAISRHFRGFCSPSGDVILKYSFPPTDINVDDEDDDDRLLSSERLEFSPGGAFVSGMGGVFILLCDESFAGESNTGLCVQ